MSLGQVVELAEQSFPAGCHRLSTSPSAQLPLAPSKAVETFYSLKPLKMIFENHLYRDNQSEITPLG